MLASSSRDDNLSLPSNPTTEYPMKKIALLAALALSSSVALANSCPTLMKQIDGALPGAKLNASQMAEVKKLRADGEAFHKAGKHSDSEAALKKAKGILKIK
jgi:hypothetical protein